MNENELNLFIMCCALILVMPVGWGLRYSFDQFMLCGDWDDNCLQYNFDYVCSAIVIEIILLMVVVHTTKKAFRKKEKVGI